MPKILYLSDVPAYGESRGGAVIAYRLLKSIPAEQLVVVETNYFNEGVDYNPNHPLVGVKYLSFKYPFSRLRNSRFTQYYTKLIIQFRSCFYKKLEQIIRDNNITKIITVSHGYMYYIATGLAQKLNIHCYAIHHDLYRNTININKNKAASLIDPLFARAYNYNTINFCVSPFMQTMYDKLFSGKSIVLYPNRDIEATKNYAQEHLITSSDNKTELTFAYLGTIASKPVLNLIESFANFIGESKHSLQLLSNIHIDTLKSLHLQHNNVIISPWIASGRLLEYLCNNIDVLVLLQDNEPQSIDAISINFPSKLTDYTQTGLPILIIGPQAGSAYKFGKMNKQAFWTVAADDSIDFDNLREILAEMALNITRAHMGNEASLLGEKLFSFSNIQENFAKPILAN